MEGGFKAVTTGESSPGFSISKANIRALRKLSGFFLALLFTGRSAGNLAPLSFSIIYKSLALSTVFSTSFKETTFSLSHLLIPVALKPIYVHPSILFFLRGAPFPNHVVKPPSHAQVVIPSHSIWRGSQQDYIFLLTSIK